MGEGGWGIAISKRGAVTAMGSFSAFGVVLGSGNTQGVFSSTYLCEHWYARLCGFFTCANLKSFH